MKAGFWACGIYPFSPEEVIKRVPKRICEEIPLGSRMDEILLHRKLNCKINLDHQKFPFTPHRRYSPDSDYLPLSVYESIRETTNKNMPSESALLEDFPCYSSKDEKAEKNKDNQSSGHKEKIEENGKPKENDFAIIKVHIKKSTKHKFYVD